MFWLDWDDSPDAEDTFYSNCQLRKYARNALVRKARLLTSLPLRTGSYFAPNDRNGRS
jgi:hypothetical protein